MEGLMKRVFILLLIFTLCSGCTTKTDKKVIKTPEVSYTKKANTKKVSFLAVGDNLIHDSIYKEADEQDGKKNSKYSFDFLYKNVKKDIKNADLSFINQETIMGGGKASGYPAFNTPDAMANTLNNLGFDILNAATNHSLDKGNKGIRHEINLLKKYQNMTLIGLYQTKKQYQNNKIWYMKRNGLTFALLSYTYGTNGIKGNGWNLSKFNKNRIKQAVKTAKKKADFVIVSAHWGQEYSHTTNKMQKKYAKYFNRLGVDLVVGTHSHVIQPMQWLNYKGHKTLVIYSLGNFISSHSTPIAATAIGGMFTCDFEKNGDKKSIKNVVWTPLVMYFTKSRRKQRVYKYVTYRDSLARSHKFKGMTKKKIKKLTDQVIGKGFKINYGK